MIYKNTVIALILALNLSPVFSQSGRLEVQEDVPLGSIRLSDPFILADKNTATYYMTGTGGLLWKSKDLGKWTGPYRVIQTDPDSWHPFSW